jgi:hypothetical protein
MMRRVAAAGGEPAAEEIFERLLDGDPTAPVDLAELYLDRLTDWLIARNRRVEPESCATAAEDAILALIKRPRAYEPERQTLEVYLRVSAKGDLKNLLQREGRHRSRRASLESVELSPAAGKYLGREDDDPARIVVLREEVAARVAARPPAAKLELTAEEERVLSLMRAGERRTGIYAAALGIEHLPIAEQRREVKRVKDRLNRRVERAERGGA